MEFRLILVGGLKPIAEYQPAGEIIQYVSENGRYYPILKRMAIGSWDIPYSNKSTSISTPWYSIESALKFLDGMTPHHCHVRGVHWPVMMFHPG